jgi:hypothetical protein
VGIRPSRQISDLTHSSPERELVAVAQRISVQEAGAKDVTREDLQQAIFDSFNGLTSALGVSAGLIVAGTTPDRGSSLAPLGLAVAATVGMGAGEYLSEESRNLRLALVIAAATLVGASFRLCRLRLGTALLS